MRLSVTTALSSTLSRMVAISATSVFSASWAEGGGAGVLDFSTMSQIELVAPASVWFEGEVVSGFNLSQPAPGALHDPSFSGMTYRWEFGDPGVYANTELNVLNVWKNRNVQIAKNGCYTFGEPGTYDVTLWAVDSNGVTGSVTKQIVIQDPDTYYAGSRTICVSQASNFTGAPAGAQQVTTIAAARTAARVLGQTSRTLLRAGEVFTDVNWECSAPQINLRVGSFGAGADPILYPAPGGNTASNGGTIFTFSNGSPVLDAVLYNLTGRGDWDAEYESGDPREGFFGTSNADGVRRTMYQCHVTGMAGQNLLFPENQDALSVIFDCFVGHYMDYGCFSGWSSAPGENSYTYDNRVATIGSSLRANPNACIGNYGKIGLSNQHGCWRIADDRRVIIHACDGLSLSSWPGGMQPPFRLWSAGNGTPTGGQEYVITCCVVEGGDGPGAAAPQNTGGNAVPGNYLFENIIYITNYANTQGFGAGYGGQTFRNVVYIRVPIDSARVTGFPISGQPATQGPPFTLDTSSFPQVDGNAGTPVALHNCTFYNMHTASTAFSSTGGFTSVTIENNVNHQPNAGVTADGPVTLVAIPEIRVFTQGFRKGPKKNVLRLASSVASGASIAVAYPPGTGQADFSASDKHTIALGGTSPEFGDGTEGIGNQFYWSWRGDVSLVFGPSTITITNTSGVTWNIGQILRYGLHQHTLATDTRFASPASGSLVIPVAASGSPAFGTASGLVTYRDIFDTVRAATADRGAAEAA